MTLKPERISFLKNKTLNFAIKIGLIFGGTAIAGALVGNFLDSQFNIAPFGTIITLVILYAVSWGLVLKVSSDMQKIIKESKQDKSAK